jgi:hypothetical protein
LIRIQWGDGLLRNSQRFERRPRAHPLPEQDTQQSGTRIQRGDELLRNGSRIWEASHIGCIVATDCAGGDSDCAAPFDEHSTTLQRGRRIQQFHSTPLGKCHKSSVQRRGEVSQSLHWGDGLLRNGSRILGKRLAVLPLIMQVVTVTVLLKLPPENIPPPCKTCTSHHNGQDD